ncbi:MAG: peptide chain release factor 1 [Oscillospiraceae bacterium]|nr:peptide chain release factor 1 [Oscillospiraceae bacterium]MCL2279588.1 peptide chain release factor 1 [Oscillospiraceae bacterium]
MLEKLKEIEEKFNLLQQRMEAPEVYSDPAQYAKLAREQKEIQPVVEAYKLYEKAVRDMDGARELMADPELREMAQEEFEAAEAEKERLEEELKYLLLPRDPNDDNNVIIEIRGGAGGDEAALFAHSLYRMYTMYAETKRWKAEIANLNETELGGIKEVSFIIEGDGAYSRFKFESGVHRVQRVPETETSGRIHTSTVTVAVLPEVEEAHFEINPADLNIDTFRASGAGGQHVNKTESAIRITHLPTGTVVECQDERSQHKNKDRAMKILASRLYEVERQKQEAEQAAQRRSQVGTGDRSERIRTYNYPQGRVTDHRIGLTLYKLEQILNGSLDEVIDALIMADRAEALKASGS